MKELLDDYWLISIILYLIIAISTFIPVIIAIFKKVKLNPDGAGYKESIHFNNEEKLQLDQHYSRLDGTLGYWKNQAAKYRSAKNYSIAWTIFISILIPIISQSIGSESSKWFLTIISTHVALIVGFHRAFKVEKNYQLFRLAESEFYDLRRELLEMPSNFGETSQEQISNFFTQVRSLRKDARKAEIDNTPTIENAKKIDT